MEHMVDEKSLTGSLGAIVLSIVSEVSKSEILFASTLIVTITTIVYNILKIRETLKKK